MEITFKLYAGLSTSLPEGAVQNTITINVDEGASVMDVLKKYDVPLEKCHLILINGNYTALAAADQKILQNDDVLAVWPPVAGG